jgi:hypothetical protein
MRARLAEVRTLALLVVLAVAAAIVPVPAPTIERWYSNGIYPWIQSVMTPAANHVPIAILDIAAAVVLVFVAAAFAHRVRSIGVARAVLRTIRSTGCGAALLYLLFLGLWGLNYRRVPLEQKLDYERSRVTRAAAIELANTAAVSVNRGHAAAHAGPPDISSLERSFEQAQRMLGAQRTAVPGVPKQSVLSFYFRRAAIDGMTDPFFLEIIVNPDVLDIERPMVLTHEWAHLAGYANESEASFLAWLTCVRGDALAQYSAWISAYEHAFRALPREDRAALTPLEAGPRDDLQAIGARYSRSSPAVRQAARSVYDGYLRAHRVPEGIGSYDAVLRLMLGTGFDPGWTPRKMSTAGAPEKIGARY